VNGLDVTLIRRAPFALDVAFEASVGVTVLFGASGAGKTTTLDLILGATRPDTGRIVLGDRTLLDTANGVDLRTRDRRIGIVFQDALLFPHLSAHGNVAFGADARAATDWLHRVGASALADRTPGELSGGERQRVALARALAASPRALLLDEPFSSLDVAGRHALGDRIRDLAHDTGTPFVLVTHDLGEAIRLGDRMVVLHEGATVRSGRPSDLLARPEDLRRLLAHGDDNLYAARIVAHRPQDGYTIVDLGGLEVDVPLLRDATGANVGVALRAEEVLVCREHPGPTSARNALPGRITAIEATGGVAIVEVATPVPVRARVTAEAIRELQLAEGVGVHLLIKASSFRPLA
jgi:molybdate transport system ATP-binding protein